MPSCSTSLCGLGGWGGPLPGDPSNDIILSAVSAYGGIAVSWTYPTTNSYAVSHVKVFRGTSSNYATAVKVAEVGGSYYFDQLTDSVNPYYYWIQVVSINGTIGDLIGPASATSTPALLDLLDKLAGQITSSQLAVALRAEIDSLPVLRNDLIVGMSTLAGEDQVLSAAVAEVDLAIANALTLLSNEVGTRAGETSALAVQLDAVSLIAAAELEIERDTRVKQAYAEARDRIASAEANAQAILRAILANETTALNAASAVALARQELRTDIQAGVSAEASARLLLATRLDTADAVTTALVNSESLARTTAISAEAAQRDLLAAQFRGTYTGSDLAAVTEGLFFQERTARSTEDLALAQQITLLSAGSGEQFDWASIWYFDSSVEGWAGNGTPTVAGGFLRPANQASDAYVESPGDLTIDGTKYGQVRLRVRKTGTVTWGGYLYWKGTADTTWDVARRVALTEPTFDVNGIGLVTANPTFPASVKQVRVDLSSVQDASNYMELDWFAVGRPSPGASSAQLLEMQTTQAGINTALATATTDLSAQVNNLTTGLPAAHSLISTNYTTLAGVDTAQATATTLLTARVDVNEDDVAQAQADIIENFDTLAAADLAESTARLALSAVVNDPVTGLPKTRADLVDFQLAQATADGATARDVKTLQVFGKATDEDVLRALLLGEDTRVAVNASIALARQELNTNIVTGLLAEANARLTLAAVVNTTSALLQSEQIVRATNEAATAASLLTLSTNIDDVQATLVNDYLTAVDTESAIAASNVILNAAIDDVDARVTTVESSKIGYCTIAGSATDHTTRGTCELAGGTWNVGIPIAQAVKQVAVGDGTGSATLEARFTAQKTLNDGFMAQHTIKLDVNGYLSGYGIYADEVGNSEFIANVSKFAVMTPEGAIPLWTASQVVVARSVRRIAGVDSKMFVCKTGGTTGTVAPSIAGGIGVRVGDGTVIWQIASRVPLAVLGVPVTLNGESMGPGVQIDGAYVEDGTLYVNAARVLGLLTAGQIDTRGLTIRNEAGDVVLSAGASLNSQITMIGSIPVANVESTSGATTKANTAEMNAILAAAMDATTKANTARTTAEAYALAQANLANTTAQAYADGIVDDEEARAIADATAKADAAQAAAVSAAAADATAKANVAALTSTWSGVSGSGKPQDNATVGATIGGNLGGVFSQQSWDVVMPNAYIRSLQIQDLRTANYAETYEGYPSAGAKLASAGTALKVASGSLQVGTAYFTDYWYRLINAIDGAVGTNLVWRGNNDTTTRGGAPNIDCLSLYTQSGWADAGNFCVLPMTYTIQPTTGTDNLDSLRHMQIDVYEDDGGASPHWTQYVQLADRIYANATHSNVLNAARGSFSLTSRPSIAPSGNFHYSGHPYCFSGHLLVQMFNAYGVSAQRWFHANGNTLGVALNRNTSPPGGAPAPGDGGGGGGTGGMCPAPWVMVTLMGGRQIAASDLFDGAQVMAVDDSTLEAVQGGGVVRHPTVLWRQRIEVTVSGGRKTEWSRDHRFYVVGKGWLEIQHLRVGDVIAGPVENRVENISATGEGPVISFQVEGAGTYFGGDLLSHNLKQIDV